MRPLLTLCGFIIGICIAVVLSGAVLGSCAAVFVEGFLATSKAIRPIHSASQPQPPRPQALATNRVPLLRR